MILGKYVILDRIGSGSMGRVYKATHQLMGRVVALKILPPQAATGPGFAERFSRERFADEMAAQMAETATW